MANEQITVDKKHVIHFDDLLIQAGELGRYQIFLFFSSMPFYVFGVFVYYSQLFMTQAPAQYWCWIPELSSLTKEERRRLAIPLDTNEPYGYSQCLSYKADWSEVLKLEMKPNKEWKKVPCEHGWEFDFSDIPYPTVSSDWGWVCDKNSYQASAQAIFFVGSTVGGLFFGWLADNYGRLPVLVLSNVVGCVGGLASVFTTNFAEFVSARFVMGMACDNCMMMIFLFILEYVSPRYRTCLANLSMALFYCITAVSIPWIVLACGHWKTIGLVTSLPMLLALLCPLVFMESPRWLLSKGRVDDAINKVLKIGKINKKEISPELIVQFKSAALEQEKDEHATILRILKRPSLRSKFVIVCLLFMCISIIFDALVRSLGQLKFDFFVSFSVVAITEFPSLLLVALVMDYCGRRQLTTLMMLICSVFSIAMIFLSSGIPSVCCAFVARFAVNMSLNAVMQWASELLPTPVRGSGECFVRLCGSIGNIIGPYVVYLSTVRPWLPLLIVGCTAGVGSVLAVLLPETAKKEMPQTFDDAEKLIQNQKFWEFPCLSRNKPKKVFMQDNVRNES